MCFLVFLTRTVYFNELDEREKYTFRVKKPENTFSDCLTRAVYFNELDEREKYTFRVKKPENVFSGFLTRPGGPDALMDLKPPQQNFIAGLLATLGWR